MIEQKGVKRDNGSLAVVSADPSALAEYKKIKAEKKRISNINKEVDELKIQVSSLEEKVQYLENLLLTLIRPDE
ncbi:hypothetical protein phiOC_p047 [Ochrobactrum phage vB_OspM_OC]|nr:hypothetical protein phiOC_p047 [Ochrobactrum phage vB_OspM_OC]